MGAIGRFLGISLVAASVLAPLHAAANVQSERSRSCWAQAQAKALHGHARTSFHRRCVEGAMAPATPTRPIAGGPVEKAITAPSGEDRTQRSADCAAEADRKTTNENDRKAARMSCMASAAPASRTGTPTSPPAPTHSKDALGVTPPH